MTALAIFAAFLGLAGASGAAHLILLAAVLAGSVSVLDAVTERVAGRGGVAEGMTAVAGLVCVLGAAAGGTPLLALGCVAFTVAERGLGLQRASSNLGLPDLRARGRSLEPG